MLVLIDIETYINEYKHLFIVFLEYNIFLPDGSVCRTILPDAGCPVRDRLRGLHIPHPETHESKTVG